MGGPRKSEDAATPPIGEAVSRIEAALHAGLGGSDGKRPDLARKALSGAPAAADHLEEWLEAVAAELQASAPEPVPEALVQSIAQKMIADPERSLGAHARIADEITRNLVRRP